ncbi:hypothetical protein [Bradyrhizobium pachyrhizi]|uniref:hypothetical protein n=1 Tax=Bradyrhizobium pachyrhizi TaxID=280333 RepID=UPI003D36D113
MANARVNSIAMHKARLQLVADEQRAAMDLRAERIQCRAQRIADEIVDVLAVEVRLAIVARKQRLGEAVEDRLQRVPRGRAACLAVAPDAMGLLAGGAQLGHDPIELPAARLSAD